MNTVRRPSPRSFARGLLSSFALLLLISVVAHAESPPRVLRFSPEGTVKNVRQVTAQFSEPMVPFGRSFEGAMPFEVDCPEKGSARWIDTTRWAYDFARDLPAGVRCTFSLRDGLRTLTGTPFASRPEFQFDTGGPAVVESMPWQGSEDVDAQQAFVLVLDAEPDLASVVANARFSIEGISERVGVNVLSGADRDALLKHFKSFVNNRPVLVLAAKQSFPNAAAVSLIWGKGIKTTSGVATTQDQTLNYKTRKPFEAALRCERENAHAACIPVTPISLWFSEPIAMALAKQITVVAPDGARIAPTISPDDQNNASISEVTFRGPFKESAQYKIELPPNLVDDAGRALSNTSRFPMTVATGQFPPLAKFSSRFGIVEAADPVLPVTVRNLEAQIRGHQMRAQGDESLLTRIQATLWRMPDPTAASALSWMRKVAAAHRATSVFSDPENSGAHEFTMPKPNGAKAFEVMGIPLRKPGFYVVELESKRLGQDLLDTDAPLYVPTVALVTDLAVHFKKGNQNSLIWVTELESAKPVPDAAIAIADCNGKEIWHGTSDARGIAMVSGVLALNALPKCDRTLDEHPDPDSSSEQVTPIGELDTGVIVTARKGADFSFVHSSWRQGIEAWRFHLPEEDQSPNFAAHTVLDRPLFRAGETVHMKHFIRAKTVGGFSIPHADAMPNALSIRHSGSDEHYDFDLSWSANGTAELNWDIPKTAKLGEYEITMTRAKKTTATPSAEDSGEAETAASPIIGGSFRVEEFRVPLMRAAIRMPTAPQVAVTSVPIDLSAEYLSGGAAKGLPITIRSQLNPDAFPQFPDFEHFTFANGTVTEGVVREGEDTEEETPPPQHAGVHQRVDLVLDAAGGARSEITGIKAAPTPVEVTAEMEFRDPNGETQTVSNKTIIWPAKRLVGISIPDWIAATDKPKVHLAVVDATGKPIAAAPVNVTLFTRKRYSYRKRLIGGFYAYENITDTERLGELCSGKTDAHGLIVCDAKTAATGEVVAQATVTDDAGHSSSAFLEIYIPGDDRFLFRGHDEDRMDVLPEQPQYQPGETARFQVRMPFSAATALVTVEREGVIAASVLQLSGKDPSITLPVRDYAPNVFVSVLAVRGRVGSIQPTAMIDLGKPAFKLGIAEIRVGWSDHELKVRVAPERAIYHVREKARVKISVRTASGNAPPAGSEVALAAVDEGLLELMHNDSWKLLDAMMGRRSYQIETSTAQMQVVGKRHYGLKAIPPGGGGGHQVTRKLFDTLLLWKASVPLDANGDASVEVPLNDSLTSFRIVAIASAETGLFGTGAASIKSTQDLMILPGISPIIRFGDAFTAEFTVRNASERPLDIAVTGKIDGLNQPLAEKLTLAPGDGKAVNWNVTVAAASGDLTYHVDAVAKNASDHVQVVQRVLPVAPVRTYQATLMRLDKPLDVPVAAPLGALPAEGGVVVGLRPSLVAGLEGVRQWMRAYPYICLEQRVSRAVALHDGNLWSGVVAELPSYVDSDGLLKYFPAMPNGSDVLTAYVLAVTNEAGLKIPPSIEEKMRDGLRGFVEGKIIRDEAIQTVDLPMRKLAAIEALTRVEKIEPALLGSLTIEPNLWPDSAVLDWWSILLRTPALPDRQKRIEEAEQIIRSRLNSQGTAMHLSSDPRNDFWWLMVSPPENMARLTLLLLDNKLWNDDISRVTAGMIAMQIRGNWETTVANAWGTLATEKFAAAFESQPVTGQTTATLNAAKQVLAWQQNPGGGKLELAWPAAQADLHLEHSGTGSSWAIIQANAAVPTTQPITSGYTITKTITPVEASHAGGWRRGDLIRVHLKIEAQSDMTWVVVNDPIPAGASHLGTGLQRDSQIAVAGEQRSTEALLMNTRGGPTLAFESDLFWPDFIERPFDAYRAYYHYIPKGSFDVEYTIRVNQAGQFQMPSTRVEALYEPEMLGEIPNARFDVAQ